MRVVLFVLVAFFAGFTCETDARIQSGTISDAPPRASLIQVSSPNAAGEVTVTGRPGAVPGGHLVIPITLETGHLAYTWAAADGSFSISLFAPAGTAILVKAGSFPPETRVVEDYLQIGHVAGLLQGRPGTILHTAAPPTSGAGIAFATAGPAGVAPGNKPALPSWTFAGTINTQALQPGDTLTIRGALRMVSQLFRTANNMSVRARATLGRLSGPDGAASQPRNLWASTFLTPTNLPIEHFADRYPGAWGVNPRFPITVTDGTRAEASVELSFRVPADLPAGFFRPLVAFDFENVPFETSPTVVVVNTGTRDPFGVEALLPIIRVGEPAVPRLPWMLLVDNPSNGTRGVQALEDRTRFALASRILTQSETFVVPRTDPASGQPFVYRLEPFAPTVDVAVNHGPPSTPLIPFRFPSGRLTVRLQKPDGSVTVIGPAPFAQPRMKSLLGSAGQDLVGGNPSITETYQLSTLDPRFEVQFSQDGLHVITLEGSIEDIWGNTWSGGGTYEVYVGRQLSLDTAVLPGTPFEVGASFNPGLTLTPPVPAQVEVRFQLAPNSEPSRMVERVVRGQANRFGYFQPSGAGIVLDQPGEYRVDVTASYRDQQGRIWVGARTWGGVVAARNPAIIAHGRRGIDDQPSTGRPQWYFRTQTGRPIGNGHVQFAFHSGDVMWLEKSDSVIPRITFQDPLGSVTNVMRTRRGYSAEDAVVGEAPLFSSRPDGLELELDPAKIDLRAYSYASVQRPLVRVREVIADGDLHDPYWRFSALYGGQIGSGLSGDLPNDIKFQYGAAVVRGPAIGQPHYAIYGSLFVLVPDQEPGGGTRVFPPFQGNGGGPSGGPIMRLKGQDIDLFIHLTGIRPGSVLEVGDNFSIAGAVGSTLPALVSTKVTTPSGSARQFSGRANRVGYYYRPQDDFAATEPGIYTVDVRVTFDGQTSAGQVTAPFPTGDVLGSASGRFFVYVVPRDSPLLTVNLPETMTVAPPGRLDLTARAPTGQNITSGHVTTLMPGFLLQTNQLTSSAGALSYRYDPATLARDFPNLDLDPPADVITLSLFGQTTNAQGQTSFAARMLALHGQEFFNLAPTRAPARAVASVSAASFSGTTLASESIVAAFGTGLAITTQAAATLPLPSSLAGTTINVRDSAGAERQSPLFFVSPAQANYQIPPGTAPGTATVTITNRYGEVSAGTVRIATVAPGLFAANANGQGVAAAVALRIKADGTQSFEPVARFDVATNRFVPALIDLGPETDQVFLILFGTGVRFNSGLSATTVNIGGVSSEVLFAGAAPGFVGLDQANVRLPRSLIGRGEVEIRLSADGQQANVVTVNVK
jgi:uncharacterized protein (TIGR03437 family)